MASPSSSSLAISQPSYNYDVFLSFRGEDTREGFTDHLYKALKQDGIRTFREDDAMERGRMLEIELEKAIHESAISLIVFSKSYASSTWCLDELLMSIKKYKSSSYKHQVVPVFYKVDPSDVRKQKGSFKDAFDAYGDEIKAETNLEKKKELMEKVGAWRDCLKKAANLTGMVLTDGMYESKFITEIVNVIRKKVAYKKLYIMENLVGIEDNVAEIESWLQDPSPVLLIHGMGGIGKSTISKCIYNSNKNNYEASCFLAKIHETSMQYNGLCRLQSQLLLKVLKREKEETIWSVDEGIIDITNAISSKKVLLLLDDVTSSEQLNALLGPSQRFYPGSKVIITTRNKELSTTFKDDLKVKVQSVRPLSMGDATELFSLYAFHQHQPIKPYISQSQLVVHHCTGLPLALRVLGSSLRGKTIAEWEDTMRQLETYPDPEIQDVLEISYKTLRHDNDKELFLHIACFFEGEEKDYIVKLLSECDLYPVVGIMNLKNRCLLDIDEHGRVVMHQLIKEMGREVVRKESEKEPGKRSRLWQHQDCIDVLQDLSGTEKVQGLMLVMPEMKEAKSTRSIRNYFGKRMHGDNANFEIGALENMKNLMLLQLNYVKFSGKCKKLPRKLRLLRWHGCALKAIPCDIVLEKLVVLDMSHSKLKRVWDGFKMIESVKILNLSYSTELAKTPDFRGLPGLESLILKGCSSLIKVDESIKYLKELVLLDLTNCTSLMEFPCFPTSLVSLQVSGCQVLQLIKSLSSVPSFSLLAKMNLSYCNLFDNSFPSEWSSLVSLFELDISGNKVTYLPKCIQALPTIQNLCVAYCKNIQTILGLPETLRHLDCDGNESLEKVQLTQNRLSSVYLALCEKLCEIEGCFKIRSIDQVERKIIRYIGLESNTNEGMELGLKVLHEFGIFSTCVSGKLIPSASGFMYKERGPQISFDVPRQDDNLRISGFSMCVVLPHSSRYQFYSLLIKVYNKTKDLLWRYFSEVQRIPKNDENYAWLSVWRCGNLLEAGDEITIHIYDQVANFMSWTVEADIPETVEECRINLLYGDDEQLDGETKEARDVSMFDQISWNDKMDSNISDFVHRGSINSFTSTKTKPLIEALQINFAP